MPSNSNPYNDLRLRPSGGGGGGGGGGEGDMIMRLYS